MFVLCSRDLNVLCAQRIVGFFYLDYPQIHEVRKSHRLVCFCDKCVEHFFSFFFALQEDSRSKLQEELLQGIYKAWTRRKALLGQLKKLEDEVHQLSDTKNTEHTSHTQSLAATGVQSFSVSSAEMRPSPVLALPVHNPQPVAPRAIASRPLPLSSAQTPAQTTALSFSLNRTRPLLLFRSQTQPRTGAQPSSAVPRVHTAVSGNAAVKHTSKDKCASALAESKSANGLKDCTMGNSDKSSASTGFARKGAFPPASPVHVNSPSTVSRSSPESSSTVSARFNSEIDAVVAVAQSGLSCVSPLSPVSCPSFVSSTFSSATVSSPLTSLAKSTQKYLTSFSNQSAFTPQMPQVIPSDVRATFPASQMPLQAPAAPQPTPPQSVDASGIRLLCDLLNGTLPEFVPCSVQPITTSTRSSPWVTTSVLPMTSHVTPSRGVPYTAGVIPTLGRKTPGSSVSTNSQAMTASPVTATNKAPTRNDKPKNSSGASSPPQGERARGAPFSIESIVSTSAKAGAGAATHSPSGGSPTDTNKRSPQSNNRSPTNFSIAHLTRDMDTGSPLGSSNKRSPDSSRAVVSAQSGPNSEAQTRNSPLLTRVSTPSQRSPRLPDSMTSSGPSVLGGSAEPLNRTPQVCSPKRKNSPSPVVVQVPAVTQGSRAAQEQGDAERKLSPVVTGPSGQGEPVARATTPDVHTSPEKGGKRDDKEGLRTSPQVTSSVSPVDGAVSSSLSPSRSKESVTENVGWSSDDFMNFPLDMIPLPAGEGPGSAIRSSGSRSGKDCRSQGAAPKPPNPDAEVSSLMAGGSLPQSPSISSSELKPGSAVPESCTPVLVDSNPCSARSPIPVPSSATLKFHPSQALPSFCSVFSFPSGASLTETSENKR